MTVRAAGRHPITEGLAEFPSWTECTTSCGGRPESRVLLEADKPEGEKAVAWIGPWEKSRVVVIQLGHGKEAHENANYRRLVRNAIVWAAGCSRRTLRLGRFHETCEYVTLVRNVKHAASEGMRLDC